MHHVLSYSNSCLCWCLAYICEGISDLRIYVAVTSPYARDRDVTQEEGKYFPDNNKDQGWLSLHYTKVIDWPDPSRHQASTLGETPQAKQARPKSLRSRRILFFSWQSGRATLHCWSFKRHLEDLVQCGYLEEFVLDQEEDPEVGDTPAESID